MTEKLTQEELEKPVKRYQIEALSDKLDVMKDGFDEKLTTIINQTSVLVTQDQLKIETKKIYEYIGNELIKVNDRVDCEVVGVKKETKKFYGVVMVAIVLLFVNLIVSVLKGQWIG